MDRGLISIKNCIDDKKLYNQAKRSLKNNELMFIDQLIDSENKVLLNWRMIQILQHTMKGPTPNWYNEVKNKITNTGTYNLQDPWTNFPWKDQHIQVISPPENQDRRFKNWYIWQESTNNKQICWGKGKGTIPKSNITLVHYIPLID